MIFGVKPAHLDDAGPTLFPTVSLAEISSERAMFLRQAIYVLATSKAMTQRGG
jgi:hypothetical protein